jgi:hypothetical protein
MIEEIEVDRDADERFRGNLKRHIDMTFGRDESGIWMLGFLMSLGRMFESINTGNAQTYALSGGQDFVNAIADMIYEVRPDVYHKAIDLAKSGEFRPITTG